MPRERPLHIKGCGTPMATAPSRTMSRWQPCLATDREILLRPDVGEGRNNVLKRSWCACPRSESVHARLFEGERRPERGTPLKGRRTASDVSQLRATVEQWRCCMLTAMSL